MSMSVKIIFDVRKIDDYGIGTYIKNIFGGLIESGKFDYKIISLKSTESKIGIPEKTIFVKSKNYTLNEHIEISLIMNKMKNYAYFSPHYVFPYFIKNRLFITIHDIIHFKFSHLFPAYKVKAARIFIRKAKKRADTIFTVSNKTKADLINYFGFKEEKIKVFYNGVDEKFFEIKKEKKFSDPPYILYIGNTTPHKNLKTLLRAFSLFAMRDKNVNLTLVGIRDKKYVLKEITRLNIRERINIKPFLPFEKIIPIIDNSLFFVFPSLYEGFGLPPLEVMARGKAVISSTGGSLPEILGDNSLYFDPNSEEELSDKIYLLVNNPELRKHYEKRGRIHSEKFRWKKFIKEYIDFFEKNY